MDFILEKISDSEFEKYALQIFEKQYNENVVYQEFCNFFKKNPKNVVSISQIPFLPIEFFKTHSVVCGNDLPKKYFTSSGTTSMNVSKHFVKDLLVYEKSYRKGFEYFYGNPEQYTILALLPSYLERDGSSLIYMINDLIAKTQNTDSGFYLHNVDELSEKITKLESNGRKILLIGVSYALLNLVEHKKFQLRNTIVMETGGMKGQRKEIIRQELHSILKEGLGVAQIHSEYGMTELLSQAYSLGEGKFQCVPWMKILIRDPEDPFSYLPNGKTGGINVIDLANIHSCSFIATQDLGKCHPDGTFEVLGRFDSSDIRGCNLLTIS